MKQTFYLNKYTDNSGDVFLSTNIKEGSTAFSPIGTVELDVQPIQREVEKVITPDHKTFSYNTDRVLQKIGAYDVKVVYKIKE